MKTPFPHRTPFFTASTSLLTPLLPPSPEQGSEIINGGLQSVHNTSSPALFPPHAFHLLQRGSSPGHGSCHEISPCSSMGSSRSYSVDVCSRVVLSTGCREIPAPSPPSLTWVFAGLFPHNFFLNFTSCMPFCPF